METVDRLCHGGQACPFCPFPLDDKIIDLAQKHGTKGTSPLSKIKRFLGDIFSIFKCQVAKEANTKKNLGVVQIMNVNVKLANLYLSNTC